MKNEVIRVGQLEIKFLLESAETNGSMAMFEFTVPVGAKMPLPHSHRDYDETIYGVEGVTTFTVEGKSLEIGPGNGVLFRAGLCMASTTRSKPMRRRWQSLLRRSWVRSSSRRRQPS